MSCCILTAACWSTPAFAADPFPTIGPVTREASGTGPLGPISGSFDASCLPTVGEAPAPQQPPASTTEILRARAAIGSVLEDQGKAVIDAMVDEFWGKYLTTLRPEGALEQWTQGVFEKDADGQLGVSPASIRKYFKAKLLGTLTSTVFWSQVTQSVGNVGRPDGADPETFLSSIGLGGVAQSGLHSACGWRTWHGDGQPAGEDVSLWLGGDLFALDHSSGMFARTDWTGEVPPLTGVSFRPVKAIDPTWLVVQTTSFDYDVILGTIAVGSARPFDCLSGRYPQTVQEQLREALFSSARELQDWISWVPVVQLAIPETPRTCASAPATFTRFDSPLPQLAHVQVSADARYLVGWGFANNQGPYILRYERTGTRFSDPLIIATANRLNAGFDGRPRLALSADGETIAACNIGAPLASSGWPGPSTYGFAPRWPMIIDIPSRSVGWPVNGTSDPSDCTADINASGTRVWWQQYRETPGWYSVSAYPPGRPLPEPPTVALTGAVDGQRFDVAESLPGFGCVGRDARGNELAAEPTVGELTGPRAGDGLGHKEIRCEVTDNDGRTASARITIEVVDLTPPTIEPAEDVVTEATSPDGANVSFPAPVARDAVDGDVPTSCDPSSGTPFPHGITTVTCVATDEAGNRAERMFRVEVRDTRPPEIACGASDDVWHSQNVAIGCTASDQGSGLRDASQAEVTLHTTVAQGSGDENASTDLIGICDKAGNCADAGPVTGSKVDLEPPSVDLRGGGTYTVADAVNMSCAAFDGVSGLASETCSTANSTRPAYEYTLGDNAVTASATDKAGNTASSETTVTVVVTTSSLAVLTSAWIDQAGIANALSTKLELASSAPTRAAHDALLAAYRKQIAAQDGKSVSPEDAAMLLALSQNL